MNHAMIDLETLGVIHNPVLLQLGACVYETDTEVIGATLERNVNIDTCVALGASVDHGGVHFWLDGAAEARASVGAKSFHPVEWVLDELRRFLNAHQVQRVWSHGATFDLTILDWYYSRLGQKAPWRYNDARDTRTVFDLAETVFGWSPPMRDTAHTGLADAIAQAKDVQAAFRFMRTGAMKDGETIDFSALRPKGEPLVIGVPMEIRAAQGELRGVSTLAVDAEPPVFDAGKPAETFQLIGLPDYAGTVRIGANLTRAEALDIPNLFQHKKGGLYVKLGETQGLRADAVWMGNAATMEAEEPLTTYVHLFPHPVALYQRPSAEFNDPTRFWAYTVAEESRRGVTQPSDRDQSIITAVKAWIVGHGDVKSSGIIHDPEALDWIAERSGKPTPNHARIEQVIRTHLMGREAPT